MEQKLEIISITTNNNLCKSRNQDGLPKKKKKAGPFQFLRVAMYMLRSKSGKSKSTQLQAASTLKNVIGSVRPFHHQGDQSPRPMEEALHEPGSEPMTTMSNQLIEKFEHMPPMSPAQQSSSSASFTSGLSSRYASANDLQELLRSELNDDDNEYDHEDEEDKYYDDKHGDEMIDFKAEEFIAKFYEQLRIQRQT